MTENNKIENSEANNVINETSNSNDSDNSDNANSSDSISEHSSNEDNPSESTSKVVEYFSGAIQESRPKQNEKLITFYKLTKIDEELLEIDEERGDLPILINKLLTEISDYKSSIDSKKKGLEKLTSEEKVLSEDNQKLIDRINKFDEQKYSVRSNEEYDNIMKAIDSGYEEIEQKENRLKSLKLELENLQKEIEESSNYLVEMESGLQERESTLKEVNENIAEEEVELKKQRHSLFENLKEEDKNLYERINKMHKGEATAIVRNGNCTGCYNSIPPQKEIEIRLAEKIFTCESCGRILIAEELVSNLSQS